MTSSLLKEVSAAAAKPAFDPTLNGRYVIEMEGGKLATAQPVADDIMLVSPKSLAGVEGFLGLVPLGILDAALKYLEREGRLHPGTKPRFVD